VPIRPSTGVAGETTIVSKHCAGAGLCLPIGIERRDLRRLRCRDGALLRRREYGHRLGEDGRIKVTRPLLGRVFSYFAPYKRRGLLVLAWIAVGVTLELAPAVVFRALIDYLDRADARFGHVLLPAVAD